MKAIKTINIKKPIILLKILNDNRLLLIDTETTIRHYDTKEYSLLSGFKAGIKHKYFKNNVVFVSSDAKYLATESADSKESRLYNLQTKKALAKVNRHQGEVSCVGISPDSRYMFSCGDDGKTFAIDTNSGNLVFTLPIHVDTVNDIAFSSNSNWLATASYDRKISLFNLVTMTPKAKLQGHSAPIMKLLFLGHEKLVSTDKDSNVIIWDVHLAKVISRLEGVHDDITQLVADSDNNLLFIGTALGYILLYDLNTYKLLAKNYIKLSSSITSLAFNSIRKELIIGTEEGNLFVYNILEGEKKIKELLQEKEFAMIQKFIDQNPVLTYTKIYDSVSILWENSLKKAKASLQKGDKQTAIQLFKDFKNVPAKNKIMQKIMLEYEEFPRFTHLAKEGKLPLAYSIANAHPLYKESAIYKSLEINWKKAFTQAQKYVLDPKGTEKAKQILAPYRGLSEKTRLIQELLVKGKIYKHFRTALEQKEFKLCFELIKRHPYLKEFPEYTKIMDYGDSIYIKSQEFINQGDTHSAVKIWRILKDFTDFAEEVKYLMLDIENKQKFFDAIEEEDIVSAYNILAETDELYDTVDGKELHERWTQSLSLANKQAVIGNSKGVKNALQEYMKISSKYASIATIFGWCYMVQLEKVLKLKQDKHQHLIENGIKNYMLSFGLQDQVENLFNVFKKVYPNSKLSLDALTQGSMRMWRPAMIEDSILE